MRFSLLTLLVSGFGAVLVSSVTTPPKNGAPAELEDEKSLSADSNEIDGVEPKLTLPIDDDQTFKYSHGHGIVIDPLSETSLGNYNVNQHNVLHNSAKGTSDCPLLSDKGQQHLATSSVTSSSTLLGESSVPVEFSTADEGGLDLTVNDLLSQLHTNIGLVATDGLIENFNFYNGDPDVVIVDPPKPQVEAVEAENEIVAPPVVANIFLTSSSDSSSSSSSSSSSDSVSSGGVTGNISSTSIANPFALFSTVALVVARILLMFIPILIYVNRRRTLGPLRKKTYPASKKKTSGTKENSALSYYRGTNEVNLPYGSYNAQPEYPMNIEDYYRSSDNPEYSFNMDLDVKPYSALIDSFLSPSHSNQVFKDPGPIKSKDLYGPLGNLFLKVRGRNYKGKFSKSKR